MPTGENDARPVRVLELPFGCRDGTFSAGDFSARAQFHQTRHRVRRRAGAAQGVVVAVTRGTYRR